MAALVAVLVLPVSGWLMVLFALAVGAIGWAVGFVGYILVSGRVGNRRFRHEVERDYEERTGKPFPGWPKGQRGQEPPGEAPVGQ